jgi:hypothetical protein
LKTLRALLNAELDTLPFLEVSEALASDGGIVDEYIIALFPRYEPIALASIEPLDCSSYSFRHVTPFLNVVRRKVQPVVVQKRHPDP